jgi:t-SNARE complex subunit (syntaxin)
MLQLAGWVTNCTQQHPTATNCTQPTHPNETHQVVETIVELATIMRDLSTLVVEQGTMLDRVDHNITETAMKVGWF